MLTDTAKITGWKWDAVNGYLEVFVRGTRVAYFDDATNDLTLLTNGLVVDSGGVTITAGGLAITAGDISVDDTTTSSSGTTGSVNTLGGVGVVKDANVGGTVTVIDRFTYADSFYPANAVIETITADKTLDYLDSGKIFLCTVDSTCFTLPAMSDGGLLGVTYTIINNQAADSSVEISFSPGSADKIMGPDIAGVDDKDLVNLVGTSKRGDTCRIMCDGTDGWYVQKVIGTWTAEA